MDPYLENEQLWPAFHHQLVNSLDQALLPGLVGRYRARLGRRRYRAEKPEPASGGPEDHDEEFVEIYQVSDGRLVTLVDVVSPANKTTDAGRRAYLTTRQEAKAAGASLVEIDLVLQGRPLLDYSREGLPDWDYAVTVTRSTQPERHEIYTATLQKRLPRFRLPLAPDDRDTVLDLTAAFHRTYQQGGFAGRIDYRREPSAPLSEANRRWLGDVLKLPAAPAHEEVAALAYSLWQKEGCPHGRDQEHWYLALERLRRAGKGPTGR
jgi:hypothetical protein